MKKSVPLVLLTVAASCQLAAGDAPPLPYNSLEESRKFVRQVREKITIERSYQIETGKELTLGPGQAARLDFVDNPAGVAEFLFYYDANSVHIIYRCVDDPRSEYSSTSLHAERLSDLRSISATDAQTGLKCFTEWEPKDGRALVRFRTELFSEAQQKAFLKQRQEWKESDKHRKAVREQARAVREWNFAEEVEPFVMAMDEPSDPNMIELRTKYGLEALVRGAADEYERLRLILAWVQKQWQHDGNNAASKNDPLTILQEVSEGKRFRCVEFAYVLAGCARSLGMPARVLGLKRPDVETAESGAGHVVAEVWLRQFGKWVFVDGQWGAMPEKDGVPLNGVEFQDAVARQESGLKIRFASQGNEREYIEWVIPYLYYLDFRPGHRFYAKPSRQLAPTQGMIMLVPKGAAKPKVFQRNRPIENCTYISNPKAFYPQMNDDRRPAREDQSRGNEPRQVTTRPYEFNTDVKFTLEKGSEVHLDCPDNPYGVTEYVVYCHIPGREELIGIRAVLENGKRTECWVAPGSCEAILQQATPTPCLGVLTWQHCDGKLQVAFRASDDKEENYRTCRQYILGDKRVRQQYAKRSLIFPDSIGREQALEDLAFLTEQLKAKHPKPFERFSEEEFRAEVERLQAGLGDPVPIRKLSLGVTALLARVGDDHTKHRDFSVYEGHVNEGGKIFPVKLRYQGSHMTIEAWSPEVSPARMRVGDVVTAVNGEAMQSLIQRYGRYISVETDLQRCWTLEWAFDRYQVMLGEAADQYRLQLQDAQGQIYEETLPAAPRWLEQYMAARIRGPSFRYNFYDEGHTCLFYIRNFDRNALQEYEKTVQGLLTAMREKHTECLILDLRGNGGGDSTLGMYLLRRVIDKPYAGDLKPVSEGGWPVRLVLLCDRSTYSAASWLAMVVKDRHVGIVAGEETGGRASFFGDLHHVTLPYSLLDCEIATGYFPRRAGYDDGRGVLPDLPLDVTLDDSILVEKICAYIRKSDGQACDTDNK